MRLRPESDLRALVVVADPSDAARFGLAPVNREQELAAARAGLGEIPARELATRGQVTLNNIVAALREGYDVLYLVAHGKLVDGVPWLFLEKEDGATERVPGQDLVTRIYELEDRPRLAVLVSCQSAGAGTVEPVAQDHGALAGLGPRLAEAGVPAVIAMQGNVTMRTAATFMPVFFAGAAPRWAGGSGDVGGAWRGARTPRLVDAGALHAPEERPHRLPSRLRR